MKKLHYILFIYCLFRSGSFTLNAQLSHIEGFGIGSSLSPENSVNEIIVDSLGNFYAIGTFAGTLDFNPLGTPYFLAANAGDAFIAKYNTGRMRLGGRRSILDSKLRLEKTMICSLEAPTTLL